MPESKHNTTLHCPRVSNEIPITARYVLIGTVIVGLPKLTQSDLHERRRNARANPHRRRLGRYPRHSSDILLQSVGYEALKAKSGTDAIRIAIAEEPKLILLDMRLPDIDGVEVARALHKVPKTAQVPIVGSTVDPVSKPNREELLGAGIVDCLEKPVSLSALETLVERFVPKSG